MDDYFKEMDKMRLKYEIKKVFAEGDDVCVLYDFSIGSNTLFSYGWYHLGKSTLERNDDVLIYGQQFWLHHLADR